MRRAGASATITASAADIESAQKVVLPGDGHFAACVSALDSLNLRGALLQAAAAKPFLGICIGMQILYEGSDEADNAPGLGILKGRIRKLPSAAGKIPHMGWNTVHPYPAAEDKANQSAKSFSPPTMRGIADGARFYFVHSYYAAPDQHTAATTHYGADIAAVAVKANVVATQFHPEKSAAPGARLLQNFVAQ